MFSDCFWNSFQVISVFYVLLNATGSVWHILSIEYSFIAITLLTLPFSIYAFSPGGHFFACSQMVILVCCNHFTHANIIKVVCAYEQLNQKSLMPLSTNFRYEVIAITGFTLSFCYLLVRRATYKVTSKEPQATCRFLYNLGSRELPSNVRHCDEEDWSAVGVVVFAVSWSLLPIVTVVNFLISNWMPVKPFIFVQRVLCLLGILHFLFLTDIVDVAYGRGHIKALRFRLIQDYVHALEYVLWISSQVLFCYQLAAKKYFVRTHSNRMVGFLFQLAFGCIGIISFIRWCLILLPGLFSWTPSLLHLLYYCHIQYSFFHVYATMIPLMLIHGMLAQSALTFYIMVGNDPVSLRFVF